MTVEITCSRNTLLEHLHDASTLLFLYQTRPEKYGGEILSVRDDIVHTIIDIYSHGGESELLQDLGPLQLSSILPLFPDRSQLKNYIGTIIQFEPEATILSMEHLISSFDHIVVLLGKKASGKGTVTHILHNDFGFSGMATGDWIRGIARAQRRSEPFDSIMLRKLGDELREEFGEDVLVWLTLQKNHRTGVCDIAFDGLRSEKELQHLLDKPNVILYWIEASDDEGCVDQTAEKDQVMLS